MTRTSDQNPAIDAGAGRRTHQAVGHLCVQGALHFTHAIECRCRQHAAMAGRQFFAEGARRGRVELSGKAQPLHEPGLQ